MSDSPLVGTCNYTGTSYDHLTGYVTGNYTSEWTDKSGTRWRTHTTIINLGKPDRGIPVDDPDAAMRPEPLPYVRPVLSTSRRGNMIANAEKRHAEAMRLFKAYMLQHGPAPVTDLLGVTEWTTRESVRVHLNLFPDVYRQFHGSLWGLHGQEPPRVEKVYSGLPAQIRATLLEFGPMTANDVAAQLDCQRAPCRVVFSHYSDLFVAVGKVKRAGIRKHLVLWGLRGVHDAL